MTPVDKAQNRMKNKLNRRSVFTKPFSIVTRRFSKILNGGIYSFSIIWVAGLMVGRLKEIRSQDVLFAFKSRPDDVATSEIAALVYPKEFAKTHRDNA